MYDSVLLYVQGLVSAMVMMTSGMIDNATSVFLYISIDMLLTTMPPKVIRRPVYTAALYVMLAKI